MSQAIASILGGFYSHAGAAVDAPIVSPVGQSIFDAGNYSARRGYVYVPTIETRSEVQSGSRIEMTKRARYLTRNVGFAKRCTRGLARMAGWMSPVPLTTDKEWNKIMADRFERVYGASPIGFDAQGRWNVYSYQPLITETRLQDGDFFSALTESENGLAMILSYEAQQVGSGDSRNEALRDGVLTNRFGKALGYNVLDKNGRGQIVGAKDMVHHADFLSVGHVRGVTALHHAVTHLLDRTELLADLKVGSKIANRIGLYVVNENAQAQHGAPRGHTLTTGSPTVGTDSHWTMKDLYESGTAGAKKIELKAGQEIKQLLDQRPHPNTLEFLDYLCRDIAVGLDMAPEVLWNIAKLGGASVRYVMADAQKAIERQQQLLVDQFLTRFWVYFCAKEMNSGRVRPCEDPNWYLVGWQAPAKLTVDVGREGRLSIDLHKAGMLTLSSWYGMQGQDWKAQVEQSVEEYAFKVLACMEAEKRLREAGHEIPVRPELVWPEMAPVKDLEEEEEPGLDEQNVVKAKPEELAAA